MKDATIFYLAIATFSYITQGAQGADGITTSPCDEISWSAFDCIQSLQQNILELQGRLSTQSDQLNETQVNLKNLQDNIVPIGYIYVQLPNQLEPQHLWETMTWTDISSQYAGLFFRVLGGGSEQFNVEQAQNSSRISQVESINLNPRRSLVNMPTSGWSLAVSSGSPPGLFVTGWGVRFFQSAAEVRPRNKAVRIWKRIN